MKHTLSTNPTQLLHGLIPTLYREIPGTAIFFMSYEYCLQWLNSLSVSKNVNPKDHLNHRELFLFSY